MELCLEHARKRHNRGVERVADLMGLASRWTLYKWMENGRMPATMIAPFEHACGCDYVTRHLAYMAHLLVYEIPAGRHPNAASINSTQALCTLAVGRLIEFGEGKASVQDTAAALTNAIEEFAWHHANVVRSSEPELPLFEPAADE